MTESLRLLEARDSTVDHSRLAPPDAEAKTTQALLLAGQTIEARSYAEREISALTST